MWSCSLATAIGGLVIGLLQGLALWALGAMLAILPVVGGLVLGVWLAVTCRQRPAPLWVFGAATIAVGVTLAALGQRVGMANAWVLASGWVGWLPFYAYEAFAAGWAWHFLRARGKHVTTPASLALSRSDNLALTFQIAFLLALSGYVILVYHVFPSLATLGLLVIMLFGARRRSRQFLLDFAPVLFTLLAYDSLRLFAGRLAPGRIHVTDIIAAERFLFRGALPGALLQHALWQRGIWSEILRLVSTAFYFSHFVVPLVLMIWLWQRERRVYWPFVSGLLTLSFLAFATYLLFPAAPPWWATYYGYLQGPWAVHAFPPPEIMLKGANPVAAMPSLHMAAPVFQALFGTYVWKKRGLWLWIFPLGVGFATLYLGQHYVVDLLAGIGYAVVVFLAFRPWLRRALSLPPAT